MAFGKLVNDKIVIDTNNALNYKNKEGDIQQRKVDTALIDVIKEAGQVAAMEHGAVLFSAKINDEWKNYFVNRDEKTHNIVLKPTNSQNRDDFIYINSNINEQGYFYYTINQKREAAKELIEGIGIIEHQNQDGTKSHYLETNARLYNEELKQELKEKGNEFIAVISNAGIRIVNEAEMKAQKQEQQIQQTQEIKEPEKTQNQEFGR
ncbi:hypothetical protein AT792_08215 [Campylobacter jejuni]|nr:hypothetical protein [Campylobacter jejuni]HAA1526019.1 hypothetical protein [Campylobacter jejuni]HAA1526207.1 hypothetical protein [Campylobacter jejuni]HEC2303726.1 hypothetical protein [Campylobacter jejuni]HEF2477971.1 hypothetical protein [Campylobacter jejuni]